jgi:hypothetical protein
LLVVGAPVWWAFWHRAQSVAELGAASEIRSTSRRVYLFLSFAVAGLIAVTSMAVILYTVFRDALEGSLATSVVHEVRAAIGLVVTAGAVSAYHWTVQRHDRAALPATAAVARPHDVLLVSADGRDVATAVAAATGAKVRRLHRLDTAVGPIDAGDVAAAVLASPHEHVLVTVEADGTVQVIPYDRA